MSNINGLNFTDNSSDPNKTEKSNMDSGSSTTDDTPMALLEQLVYIDNFFQHTDSPSTQSNDNFDDQLQRELAAFANDTFIFPDEDKPKQSSSNNNNKDGDHNNNSNTNNNDNKNSHNNNINDNSHLLSFAQASFNQISPAEMSAVTTPIPTTHYQNLSQRYNNSKQKFTYQESMSQHISSIPSTIHELLGNNTNSNTNDNGNNLNRNQNPSIKTSFDSVTNRSNSNGDSSALFDGTRNNTLTSNNTPSPHLPGSNEPKSIEIPQGAKSTLTAAGLSQTQIDALAGLVAFHKSENTNKNSSTTDNQFSQPSISPPPNLSVLHGFNRSESQSQQLQHQNLLSNDISSLNSNSNNSVNNLLINLLTQSLVPQQQIPQNNILGSLISLLAGGGNNVNQTAIVNLLLQLQQSTQPNNQNPQGNLNLQSLLANQIQPSTNSNTSTNNTNNTPIYDTASSNAGPHKKVLTFKNSVLDLNKSSEPIVRKSTTSSFNSGVNKTSTPISVTNTSPKNPSTSSVTITKDSVNKPTETTDGSSNTTTSMEPARSAKGTASVRFRQKKKLKEQEMERNLQEAKEVAEALRARIQQLEMENRLLRDLVVEKSQQRDSEEVERLRKKARLHVKGKEN